MTSVAVVAVAAMACAAPATPGGTVANDPPTAVLTADLTAGVAPQTVVFDASTSSDSDGTIVSYDWNFGDGNTSTDVSPSNVFSPYGPFTVTLIVTDDDGATDLTSQVINVDPAAGCYDSSANVLSFVYTGPMASYKNARVATNTAGCADTLTDIWTTFVRAADEPAALAACQAGPDPVADTAVSADSIGFDTLPPDTWSCTNPGSADLLEAGDCFPVGTASVLYVGPRDTLGNAELYGGNTCETGPPTPFTYVQHSTEASALLVCQSIDPLFDTATSLFPLLAVPDTYICTTA